MYSYSAIEATTTTSSSREVLVLASTVPRRATYCAKYVAAGWNQILQSTCIVTRSSVRRGSARLLALIDSYYRFVLQYYC